MSKKAEKAYDTGFADGLQLNSKIREQDTKVLESIWKAVDSLKNNSAFSEITSIVNDLIKESDNQAVERLFGICNPVSPDALENHEKQIILNILATLGKDGQNENQKRYMNNIRHILDVQGYVPDCNYDYSYLRNLEDSSVRNIKIIAKVLRVYLFLQSSDWTGVNAHENDLFSKFDLRSFDEIDSTINLFMCLYGEEGLIEMFGAPSLENYQDSVLSIDEMNERIPLTEENVCKILNISPNETKLFKNCRLHISSFVNCSGNIEIENCILYYNESASISEINLKRDSSLSIRNSIVVCKSCKDRKLLMGRHDTLIKGCDANCHISIENTIFLDCSYFIELLECASLTVKGCRFINCYDGVMSFSFEKDAIVNISDIVFTQYSLNSMYEKIDKSTDLCLILLGGEVIKDLVIKNIRVFEDESFKSTMPQLDSIEYISTSSYGVTFENSSFYGLSSPIRARVVRNCKFQACTEGISKGGLGNSVLVENCVFDNCTNIFAFDVNVQRAVIRYCQFITCYNNIISGPDCGGVEFEGCDFENIYLKKDKYGHYPSFIKLVRDDERSSSDNRITGCVFDGVKLHGGYLIDANGIFKPKGISIKISKCEIRNCTSERVDLKIIQEYFTEITKKGNKEHLAIEIASDCIGFDQAVKEFSREDAEAFETIPKAKEGVGAQAENSSICSNVTSAFKDSFLESEKYVMNDINKSMAY